MMDMMDREGIFFGDRFSEFMMYIHGFPHVELSYGWDEEVQRESNFHRQSSQVVS